MKWTEIQSGSLNGAVQRLMVAFGDSADVIVGKINTNEQVATRVAILCLNDGFEPSTSQKRAKEIMGNNFFGIEEAKKHFGCTLSKRQLAYMAEIPFAEEVLLACKDTHILIAVAPLSIVEVREKTKGVKVVRDGRLFYQQAWYDNNNVGNDKGRLEWFLVRKTPIKDSTSKTWDEQQTILPKDEETLEAQVVVYTIIGHFLNTGERLFKKVYVRCKTLDPGGNRVRVGGFDAGGLDVNDGWDDYRSGALGLSGARKLSES